MLAIRQKILMCAPDYYGVDYVINPWMEGQLGRTEKAEVQKQWEGLRTVLAKEADLAFVPPAQGLPDLVFTANAGMVRGDIAVVSRFSVKEREGEESVFKKWFEENGFKIAPWPRNVFFEGAGDALFDRGQEIIWCGHGFRSDLNAAPLLEKLFGRKAVPIKLVDPRFYHLDTCMCPLTGGYMMYYPPAFDKESQEAIAAHVPPEKRIVVAEEDALLFACNTVDLAPVVVLNECSQSLKDKLRNAGFRAVTTPLTQFLKAGGTAKCLTLKLVEP